MTPVARSGFLAGHRRALLVPTAALLWGTQFAFLNPAIGIILVSLYGASAAEVGLALAAYNVSGFVSTLVVPTRADRRGDYLEPLLWCGGFTIALTTALALATTLPLAVLALVALGGPAGIAIGLIFAYQRHTGASVQQIMRTRAVFSFAWVGGPPFAAFLMGVLGQRSVLWVVAALGTLGLALTRVMMHAHATSPHARRPPRPVTRWGPRCAGRTCSSCSRRSWPSARPSTPPSPRCRCSSPTSSGSTSSGAAWPSGPVPPWRSRSSWSSGASPRGSGPGRSSPSAASPGSRTTRRWCWCPRRWCSSPASCRTRCSSRRCPGSG
nr:MFS transporter [Phycicoccus sp. HDW14]